MRSAGSPASGMKHGTAKRGRLWTQSRRALPMELTGDLSLDFPFLGTLRNTFLVFASHPGHGIFLQQPELRQRALCRSHLWTPFPGSALLGLRNAPLLTGSSAGSSAFDLQEIPEASPAGGSLPLIAFQEAPSLSCRLSSSAQLLHRQPPESWRQHLAWTPLPLVAPGALITAHLHWHRESAWLWREGNLWCVSVPRANLHLRLYVCYTPPPTHFLYNLTVGTVGFVFPLGIFSQRIILPNFFFPRDDKSEFFEWTLSCNFQHHLLKLFGNFTDLKCYHLVFLVCLVLFGFS